MNSYLDVAIGQYSIKTVLAELARCLGLFPNLHTVQIDVISRNKSSATICGKYFELTFKKYSFPQIRNVYVKTSSVSFVSSCPQARRVGLARHWSMSGLSECLQTILDNCPHLEVLEDFGDVFWTADACECAYSSIIFFSLSAFALKF